MNNKTELARLFEITHDAIEPMDIQGGNDDRTLN